MPNFYKVLKADAFGDPWTPNMPGSKPIQNYWCQVEGQEMAVSIGKQVGNTITPGQHVYGDLMYAKSQKGTEYWKFKGSQVPEGVQRPADSPAQAQAQQAVGVDMSARMPDWFMPIANQIDFIFREMRQMSEVGEPTTEQPAPTPPAVESKPQQVAGNPLDEVTQATLDDIFTEPEPQA